MLHLDTINAIHRSVILLCHKKIRILFCNLDNMKGLQKMNRFLSVIPILWFTSFLLVGFIGIIKFGELPVYGKHIDPYALGINWLNAINMILFFSSFFTIPILGFLTTSLLVKGYILTLKDKILLILVLISITGFFLFKYSFPTFFSWVVD